MSKYLEVSFAVALFRSGVGKLHGSSTVCFGVSLLLYELEFGFMLVVGCCCWFGCCSSLFVVMS